MNLLENPIGLTIILIIIAVLILSIAAIAVLLIKYNSTKKKLMAHEMRVLGKFDDHFLDNAVKEFKEANKSKLAVNTYAIVEGNMSRHWGHILIAERFQKTAVSLMIILGLLGTFFGLTLAVSELVNVFAIEDLSNTENLIDNLVASVTGMSVAFTTSLFGIAGSIILTVVRMIFSVEQKREDILVYVEDYLDNTIAKAFAEEKFNEYDKLVNAMENVFKEFGTQISLTFTDVVKSSTAKIDNSTEAIEMLTGALKESVTTFESSLATFGDNTRDFGEFNYHLRENIQRMSLTFSDFASSLEPETKTITENTEN
jgi:hypothetical protein